MKNRFAVLALAAFATLGFAARTFAVELIDLSNDAVVKGQYEAAASATHGSNPLTANHLKESTLGTNQRWLAPNTASKHCVEFHFTDAYQPGASVVVTKLHLDVNSGVTSFNVRYPGSVTIQGSNNPTNSYIRDASSASVTSDEGWETLASTNGLVAANWSKNAKNDYCYELEFENAKSFRYYRIVMGTMSGGNNYINLSHIFLYGYTALTYPEGLEVSYASDLTAVDVTTTIQDFNPADLSEGMSAAYLDYDASGDFAEGAYTRLDLTDAAATSPWTRTTRIENLETGAAYHGRFIVVNESGFATTNAFEFATIKDFYVSGDGSDTEGDGTMANPFRSITHAFAVAAEQGVARTLVGVLPGTYAAASGETFPIALPKGAIVRGLPAESNAPVAARDHLVDGWNGAGYAPRIFSCSEGGEACEISGFHLANTGGTGVPVYSADTDMVVSNCYFTQRAPANDANGVAGILVSGDSFTTVDGCEFTIDYSQRRSWLVRLTGGSATPGSRKLTLRNCVFTNNFANAALVGAADTTQYVDIEAYDCLFEGNTAGSAQINVLNGTYGGCIVAVGKNSNPNFYGRLYVERCRFLRNVGNSVVCATYCSQATALEPALVVRNSLFAGNRPYDSAKARATIANYLAVAEVDNCTFAGNFGSYCCANGGGTFHNCIFSEETGPLNSSANITISFVGSLCFGCEPLERIWFSGVQLTNNPCFADAAYHLKPTSPALNVGTGTYGEIDLDGNPRLYGEAVDLGCYELQRPAAVSGTIFLLR